MGKGQGKEIGLIQGEKAVAPVRQDVEEKEVMEDLGKGVIFLESCKVASRNLSHQGVSQVVEVANPGKLKATRSGRINRRGSLQGNS